MLATVGDCFLKFAFTTPTAVDFTWRRTFSGTVNIQQILTVIMVWLLKEFEFQSLLKFTFSREISRTFILTVISNPEVSQIVGFLNFSFYFIFFICN